LGQIVATPAALRVIREAGHSPTEFLRRHAAGDWGNVDGHDERANLEALQDGGRLFSVYETRRGEAVWVITEADRTSTCLLLPSDY
jgi:hypothetical protein